MLARGEYTVSPLADGATGAAGRSVTSITEEYYLSTSKTAQAGGSWVASPPAWSAGKYLWTRSKIVYADPAGTVYTAPVCDSSWEAVNDVQVGGRNLILNSTFQSPVYAYASGRIKNIEYEYNKLTYTNPASVNAGPVVRFSSELIPQQEYILSMDIESSHDCTLNYVYLRSGVPEGTHGSSGTVALLSSKPLITGKNTVTWEFFLASSAICNGLWIGINKSVETTFTLSNLKLERGNKATDWTPAPEDVDAQIGDVDDRVDGVAADVSGLNTDVDEILAANADRQTAIDAQINSLTQALSSLSTGVDENSTSTQETIDTIQSMIATLEAEKATLAGKIALLEQAKINTDNYIQIGNVKLSNGATVFGVAVGKDVNVLNPDGTISTLERSMTATTANAFLILTGGEVVGVFDPSGMTSESVKVNSIVMGGKFTWQMTPSNAMVLKK